MIIRYGHGPENWKVTILASDLSLTALEVAERGVYPAEKMEWIEQGWSTVLSKGRRGAGVG
jgi:chemotaxis methyl-accepting protein methylase